MYRYTYIPTTVAGSSLSHLSRYHTYSTYNTTFTHLFLNKRYFTTSLNFLLEFHASYFIHKTRTRANYYNNTLLVWNKNSLLSIIIVNITSINNNNKRRYTFILYTTRSIQLPTLLKCIFMN